VAGCGCGWLCRLWFTSGYAISFPLSFMVTSVRCRVRRPCGTAAPRRRGAAWKCLGNFSICEPILSFVTQTLTDHRATPTLTRTSTTWAQHVTRRQAAALVTCVSWRRHWRHRRTPGGQAALGSRDRRERAVDWSARRAPTRVSVVAARGLAAFASCWRFDGGGYQSKPSVCPRELRSDAKEEARDQMNE